jgi:hypothetical protein
LFVDGLLKKVGFDLFGSGDLWVERERGMGARRALALMIGEYF